MKKLILGLFSILFILGTVQGQDTKKAYKDAKKAYGIYNLDPSGNKASLKEAAENIVVAVSGGEEAKEAQTWQLKGDIYNEIATQIVVVRQTQIGKMEDLPTVEHPALEAKDAYMKALELAEKKYETKDALKGLTTVQTNLYNLGIFNYEDKKFETAYKDFQAVIDVHDKLKKEGEDSTLDEKTAYQDQLYITGLAALNAEMAADAESLFQKLYEDKYEKPAVYEALYKIKSEQTNAEEAYVYLKTGRENFPDDVSLLFAEINHYLKIGKLDELIGKLEAAIQAEPDNVSLYSTLGNVYDNLYQREFEAGNMEEADKYFQKAFDNYEMALAKDPKFFDAIYSIGALYYNKAAAMTKELQELESDYSKEGLKKYEAKKVEVFEQFDKALPYFQKAEALNPNDINTLIALREIYARKDQLDMSNEFKDRLEKVQAGESNDASYFNK